MRYRLVWARVLEYIDQWASAREVPGGIEFTFEQSPGVLRTVEVVVTPVDMRYLIYDTYDWWPSHMPEPPPNDLLPAPGEWVATDRA